MNWVAKLGQNIQFVAACAHFFFAWWMVGHLPHKIFAATSITLAAALKEFWFDARYETNPRQTFLDNLEDFIGWLAGAWLAVVIK